MDKIDNEGVSMKTRDRIIALHKRGLANTEIAQIVTAAPQRVWSDDCGVFSVLCIVIGGLQDVRGCQEETECTCSR